MRIGIISTGQTSLAFYRAGDVTELGVEEVAILQSDCPENIVTLPAGAVWNADVAKTFLPSGENFKYAQDQELFDADWEKLLSTSQTVVTPAKNPKAERLAELDSLNRDDLEKLCKKGKIHFGPQAENDSLIAAILVAEFPEEK